MIVNYYRSNDDIRTVDILEGTPEEPMRIVRDGIVYDRVIYAGSIRCAKCAFTGIGKCSPVHGCAKGSAIWIYDEKTGTVDYTKKNVPYDSYWIRGTHCVFEKIDITQVDI